MEYKIVLKHKKLNRLFGQFTIMLVIANIQGNVQFVVCDNTDDGFEVPKDRIISSWQSGEYYGNLEDALSDFEARVAHYTK